MPFSGKTQMSAFKTIHSISEQFWLGYSPPFLVRSIITLKSHDVHQVSHVIGSCTSTLNHHQFNTADPFIIYLCI